MLRSKIGYETKVIKAIFALLLGLTLLPAVMSVMLPEEEGVAMLVLTLFMFAIAIVFGASPLFTKHEVHDTYIMIRQGWYYRNRIDLTDIKSVKLVKRGPYSYGVHFIGNGTTYVNGRLNDLILMELSETTSRNGKKRKMTKVLFDTKDNEKFLKLIGRKFDAEMETL